MKKSWGEPKNFIAYIHSKQLLTKGHVHNYLVINVHLYPHAFFLYVMVRKMRKHA